MAAKKVDKQAERVKAARLQMEKFQKACSRAGIEAKVKLIMPRGDAAKNPRERRG